jgi:hypothetical protein
LCITYLHFMKKIIPALLLLVSATCCFAQNEDNNTRTSDGSQRKMRSSCDRLYFDASTGINNNGGLLSVGLDMHVSPDISINGGIGLSSWGYKAYIGGKGYLKPCHKGWAFGGGLTYSTGLSELLTETETVLGIQAVKLQLMPQVNVFAAAYKYWRMGRHGNRCYLELGISKAVTNEKFRQLSGDPLTSRAAAIAKLPSPGGIIIGFGFSFGTRGRG